MKKDTLSKTQEEKKLDTVEVLSVEKSVLTKNDSATTDPNKEDLIVNNLALYFVSLARSISNSSTSKSS